MFTKRLSVSVEEKDDAGKILHDLFFDGKDDDLIGIWLHDYLKRRLPGVEKILASDDGSGASELSDVSLPRTLVDMFGSEIFDGDFGAELRIKMMEKLFEKEEYRKIFNIFLGSSRFDSDKIQNMKIEFNQDPKGMTTECVSSLKNDRKKHSWSPGGSFPRKFVEQMRLADIFAGISSDPPLKRVEEAIPKVDVKEIKNFQKNMKKQVIEILEGSDENRAIVTLPTGSGKTRVAVEAIVDFLNNNGVDKNILWIAQSQEVCEQAVLCFKQIWEQYGKGETLNIFRVWGKNDLPISDEYGIIVGGIQKLLSRKNDLHHLIDDAALSAVFIDEAHHSVTNSYAAILNELKISTFPNGILENDKVPLIGLTATPERRIDSETNRLHRMYGGKRIYPNEKYQPDSDSGNHFGEHWKDLGFMRTKLIEMKYLAKPTFHIIEPGKKKFRLTLDETKDFEDGCDRWIERIATEEERNKNIKNEILKWAKKGKKILYFGTNVSQSNAMARILEKENIKSVCITGDTRYATRKLFVNTFNQQDSNEIQVMCNYNVLATGFDSPQIDTVIIARPTTSIVAYQQMIGRGLRGERFGGKSGNRCDIVTVKDNISKFNDERIELGYIQYEKELEMGPAVPSEGDMFTEDKLYEVFRVQKYGGIRFTNKHNFVILVDSDMSSYEDHVDEQSGIITYTGIGEKDQGFDKGVGKFNAKVKNLNSILLYFYKPESNKLMFKHLVKYESYSYSMEKNNAKEERKVIKFKLKIVRK